jgi:hypothetical protein
MFNIASASKMQNSGWVNFAPLRREFWGGIFEKVGSASQKLHLGCHI